MKERTRAGTVIPMTTTAVHYMGSTFAQQTACGRYAGPSAMVTTTDEPAAVTCLACQKAIS